MKNWSYVDTTTLRIGNVICVEGKMYTVSAFRIDGAFVYVGTKEVGTIKMNAGALVEVYR